MDNIWNLALYFQMSLGLLTGILLIIIKHEFFLGIGVALMGVNGIGLTYLYDLETDFKEKNNISFN